MVESLEGWVGWGVGRLCIGSTTVCGGVDEIN